jgi:hypothetical protein
MALELGNGPVPITDEQIEALLQEKWLYRQRTAHLVDGYRELRPMIMEDQGGGRLGEAVVWSLVAESTATIRTEDGQLWTREELCHLLTAALDRIAELEDLNDVGLDGNRRRVIS